ncbi:MAG TPA: hypothetical protein VFK90_04395 [Anaeromyxobacter sp.]|nr:hypothetical protein [Anaeromyxobacter sp.]
MEGRPPGDPGDPLETVEEEAEEAPRGSIADGVKKALLAGVGALFMTEEGARRLARDWKLPKELIGFVTAQASGAKDEVLRLFAEEFRRFLESEAVRGEFWKALTENAIEIRAVIRFRPDAAGKPRPHVTTSARARRKKKPRR